MLDHVGYLVRDLDRGIALVESLFGVPVTSTVDRPQWSLVGAYLGSVEVFTFTDPELLDGRIGDADARLDHTAVAVPDIVAAAARMRRAGARFSGPDLRGEVADPFDLGGVLHLWTLPETTGGLCTQLMQR
jgi:catechol 2,3-dioxygenase-like lactoylglutathione lyase family enzyme